MEPAALQGLEDSEQAIVHASCVAVDGRGLLILGVSGSGKSGLALDMMALGADLVADDRVILFSSPEGVYADVPEPIRSLIEVRGLGLLRADAAGPVRLSYVLDLDRKETARLPDAHEIRLLRHSVPLLFRPAPPHLAASLVQLLRAGRAAPEAISS
ncbi:HPr kinase/phosphatase C-terminal domain-containing protein [Ruegeria sp. 1NDH52C]|uniref:HPr kinase/phosphatase C-terminal domain-containing protein n=1 Tax=Ruegeria alba TaxID=2916756 RepID=A0ABS9NZK6_9RHOB|nr:HPr kinase/phosphatase C-terminal domain-containing protein [Ruegeria alba]